VKSKIERIKNLVGCAVMLAGIFFAICPLTCGAAEAVDLLANEKKIFAEFNRDFPADRILSVAQFKTIVDEVNAGERQAYLLDLRSSNEFYTFHIEGADNIHAGHVYTIPRYISDPEAEIYIYCRTSHRAFYVAHFLQQYGYRNLRIVKGGMVAWIKAGYPVVNQYMGKFVASFADFDRDYSFDYKETGKYRVREFHPY